MSYVAFTAHDYAPFDYSRRSRPAVSQAVLCAIILVLSAATGLWILYRSDSAIAPVSPPRAMIPSAPAASARSLPLTRSAPAVPPIRRQASLLDPELTSGRKPIAFAQTAGLRPHAQTATPRATDPVVLGSAGVPVQVTTPTASNVEIATPPAGREAAILPTLQAEPELVQNIPLPPSRPALLPHVDTAPLPTVAGRRVPQGLPAAAPGAETTPKTTGFFDSLFGASQPSKSVLAYAAPEDGMRVIGGRPAGGSQTAIYDISAHTVYLPNGARLEAHSGLGASLDDPRSVATRMRGATPPNVYDLTPREAPFHGVRALRLTPVGEGTTYGRGGLLAHTFMLGPRGDSNGCVVFRDYQAFLDAYESGQVRRLQVVARLN